jgi:hypothetical protein
MYSIRRPERAAYARSNVSSDKQQSWRPVHLIIFLLLPSKRYCYRRIKRYHWVARALVNDPDESSWSLRGNKLSQRRGGLNAKCGTCQMRNFAKCGASRLESLVRTQITGEFACSEYNRSARSHVIEITWCRSCDLADSLVEPGMRTRSYNRKQRFASRAGQTMR